MVVYIMLYNKEIGPFNGSMDFRNKGRRGWTSDRVNLGGRSWGGQRETGVTRRRVKWISAAAFCFETDSPAASRPMETRWRQEYGVNRKFKFDTSTGRVVA